MCLQRADHALVGVQVRRNFAIEDSGIFAQLAALGSLLERVDGTLFYKLRQVGRCSLGLTRHVMCLLQGAMMAAWGWLAMRGLCGSVVFFNCCVGVFIRDFTSVGRREQPVSVQAFMACAASQYVASFSLGAAMHVVCCCMGLGIDLM